MKITDLKARQIFDSRGNPTIEVDLTINQSFLGRYSVPSGASKGKFEAIEKRDGGRCYHGQGVTKSVAMINEKIALLLVNKTFKTQCLLDSYIIELDNTHNKSNLGSNITLGISAAFAKAAASLSGDKLYNYFAITDIIIPTPMVNVINGGLHADNSLAIQEILIIPKKINNIEEELRIVSEIYQQLKKNLMRCGYNTNVGDEGGFAPDIHDIEECLDQVLKAARMVGYQGGRDFYLALDCAANEFYINNLYNINPHKPPITTEELLDFYFYQIDKYPILSIEDPFAETDYKGWETITQAFYNKILIVGDDLFVTNSAKLKLGISHKLANTILIKMNQIGTITETINCIKLARKHKIKHIISHRSGETEDVTISHLSVGTGAYYLKSGSIARSERVSKYNELIRINEFLMSE